MADAPVERDDLEGFYRRYNACCNDHDFGRLGEFVAADVRVDDEPRGLPGYVAGLSDVVRGFPDYRWRIRHLVVNPPIIAAHFENTGTHLGEYLGVAATGREVRAAEFAVYRVDGGRIAEVWATADDLDLLNQLRGG